MALNNEDKKDVKNAMGKAIANKVSKVTKDDSGFDVRAHHVAMRRAKLSRNSHSNAFEKAAHEDRTDAKSKALKVKSEGKSKFSHSYGVSTPEKGSSKMRYTKNFQGHEIDKKK